MIGYINSIKYYKGGFKMTKKELKQAIKKVKYIYAWTILCEGDGVYIEIKKCNLALIIKPHMENTEYKTEIRYNELDALYIN